MSFKRKQLFLLDGETYQIVKIVHTMKGKLACVNVSTEMNKFSATKLIRIDKHKAEYILLNGRCIHAYDNCV